MPFGLTLSFISNTLRSRIEMKNLLSVLIVMSTVPTLFAQQEPKVHQSSVSRKYHQYREEISEPSYHLATIKAMVKKVKEDKEGNKPVSKKVFDAMSSSEKFTYTMIHGEDASQNCDAMPPILNEESKIFGYIPSPFGDDVTWSERQRDYLTINRSTVIPLIRSTMKLRQRAGVNLKGAILHLNAVELIPDLVTTFNLKKKDFDILSLLMYLMKEGQYSEFMQSASYTKLYGEKSNYKGFLEGNVANQKLIIERAMAFYKTKIK